MPDVKCTVKNCEYWEEGNKCHAEEITIKAGTLDGTAKTLLDTVCKTFEPKES